MEIFLSVLNCILPVFVYMLIGYVARLCGIIRIEDIPRINKMAFYLFLPMLLFYNVYTSDLSSFQGSLVIFALVCIALEVALSFVIAALFLKKRSQRGVFIHGMSRTNFGIIGFSVLAILTGSNTLTGAAMITAACVPALNIMGVAVLEYYNGETKPDTKKILLDILKNPLLIMVVVGTVFALFHWKLPSGLENVAQGLCRASSPLMLVLMGAFIRPSSIRGNLKLAGLSCFCRLILYPAIFITISILWGFRGMDLATLAILLACPTATSTFPMAQEMGGDAELAGNIVMGTTLFCPLTLFLWCFILRWFGLI